MRAEAHKERVPVCSPELKLSNFSLLFKVSEGAHDLITKGKYKIKKARQEKWGSFTNKRLDSDEMKAKSLDQEKRNDKLETLSLEQWSRNAIDHSSYVLYLELNEKHKNFAVALEEKSSVVQHQSLEDQKYKFLYNLANISKCFKTENEVRNNSKEKLKYDFWKRKKLVIAQETMTESTSLMEHNREVFTNIASNKFKQAVKTQLMNIPKDNLDDELMETTALNVIDKLLNQTAPNFESLKKSEALNHFKGIQSTFITTMMDSIEPSNPIREDLIQKSNFNHNYMKYLQKRIL